VAILRYRTDGLLHSPVEFDIRLLPPIMACWKAMGACDPKETERPQHARMCLDVPETDLVAAEATWLGRPPSEPFECLVQCRAQRTAAPAIVTPLGPDRFRAEFTGGPEHSPGPISPGQPAVCYGADRILGGGWITG